MASFHAMIGHDCFKAKDIGFSRLLSYQYKSCIFYYGESFLQEVENLAEKSLNIRKDLEGVVAHALILNLLRADQRWITDISIKGLLESHTG